MKNFFIRHAAMLAMLFFSVTAMAGQWTLLGSSKVHGHRDYDEIIVTGSRGDYRAIKLFVQNEGIDFDRVVVHYGNGAVDKIEIKNFIPAGGETRVIDLAGGDRVIQKVVFYYKSNAMTSRKGKVLLYGKR
jgi:Protein of unknown function (DUF2541)